MDVRFRDDLKQGYARAVEVDPAVGSVFLCRGVHQLSRVLLHVHAFDADLPKAFHLVRLDGKIPLGGKRLVVLGDLIIFRQVGVVIVLPRHLRMPGNVAVERESSSYGHAVRRLVDDRKRPGCTHADRAYERIRVCSVPVGTGTEHLGIGLKLHVHLKTDGCAPVVIGHVVVAGIEVVPFVRCQSCGSFGARGVVRFPRVIIGAFLE